MFLATITFATLYSGILQSHGSFCGCSVTALSIRLYLNNFLSNTLGPFSMVVLSHWWRVLQTLINFLALKDWGTLLFSLI